MAGHMGSERVTTLNLEVVLADPERELILVKGAVPGPRGGLVFIRDAVKAVSDGRHNGRSSASVLVERCNDSGELLGVVQLDPEYFGALVNVPLLHQVVTAQLAAKRSGTHSTRHAPRSPVAVPSPIARRAPVVPDRAPPGRRSSQAEASPSGPSPVTTPRARLARWSVKRCGQLFRTGQWKVVSAWSTAGLTKCRRPRRPPVASGPRNRWPRARRDRQPGRGRRALVREPSERQHRRGRAADGL